MKDSHKAFVEEYLINGMNATKAYMKAFPKASIKTAEVNGFKLLDRDDVSLYIKEHQEIISKAVNITKEEIIQDLIDIKNANKYDKPVVATKAIEVINKMMGYNAVDKQEIKLQGDIEWFETKTYKNKDGDSL